MTRRRIRGLHLVLAVGILILAAIPSAAQPDSIIQKTRRTGVGRPGSCEECRPR